MSGGLAWFKFFGKDFRDGVVGLLSLEEIGAYVMVLTLIYENGGPIEDSERWIATKLGVDVRVWRRTRTRLLALSKLQFFDGHLTNSRATSELDAAVHLSEVRRTSGRSSRKISPKSEAKPLANNENAKAFAPVLLGDTRARIKNPESRDNNNRALPLDEGWRLDDDAIASGLERGLTRPQIDHAAEGHRAWWRTKRPHERMTPDGWAKAWTKHLDRIKANPDLLAALLRGVPVAIELKPQMLAAPSLPNAGPDWWIEAAARIAEAFPMSWATRWVGVTAMDEPGVVIAATGFIAKEINSGQAGNEARRLLGFEIRAIDPLDAPQRARA